MKIVIFGVGRFYQEKKQMIPLETEIVAFLDNNAALQGRFMDGCPIAAPCEVGCFSYDKIILMSLSEEEMENQLLELGVEKGNIWYWSRFMSEMYYGTFKLYCGSTDFAKAYGKRILIISTELNYNGGTIAAVYGARALQERGNLVILAAPSGDKTFIKETVDSGVSIVICPALPYVHLEELFWIRQFDAVLVNVFQMAPCVSDINAVKPVMWWIHEPVEIYERTLKQLQDIKKDKLKDINIYAVSKIAQKNFNACFLNKITKTLPFGIPDQRTKDKSSGKKEDLVLAVIGAVCPRKAQDIFVKAVGLLSVEEKQNVQFWIIGFIGNDEYGAQVRALAAKESTVKLAGPLTRSEICEAYREIDVVVCPSREETMSIVVTEGMMYGKACIASDKTGIAQYMEDGENGLICKAEEPADLCEKMRWIMQNQEKLSVMGSRARQTYETYFTMKEFGQRLEGVLQETMDQWKQTDRGF